MTAAKPLRITGPNTGPGARFAGHKSAADSLRDMRNAVVDGAEARNRVTLRKKKTRRR